MFKQASTPKTSTFHTNGFNGAKYFDDFTFIIVPVIMILGFAAGYAFYCSTQDDFYGFGEDLSDKSSDNVGKSSDNVGKSSDNGKSSDDGKSSDNSKLSDNGKSSENSLSSDQIALNN